MRERIRGTIGNLWFRDNKLAINAWEICEIENLTDAAKVYCEYKQFESFKDIFKENYKELLGSLWLIRLDNEDGLYFGSVNCVGMARPNMISEDAVKDDYKNDLCLYFTFSHSYFGPYTILEARSMAKNGNTVFFDLLEEQILQEKIIEKDVRFLSYK